MKNKKHHKITKDYNKQKSKHLEKLTNKMLKNDEHSQKLRTFAVKGDFFDLFT